MKLLLKSLLIAILLMVGKMVVAQEAKDYYKFNDKGFLCEFLLTTPDGVQIQYRSYGDKDKSGVIIYPDGTQIDYTTHLTIGWGDEPLVFPNKTVYDIRGALSIKEWYKDLRKMTTAPTGSELLDNMFGLAGGTIIFKDNSRATVKIDYNGATIEEIADVSENGDRLSIDYWGRDLTLINLKAPNIIDDKTGNVISTGLLVSGTKDSYVIGNGHTGCVSANCKGIIVTSEGNTFTGSFRVLFRDEIRNYLPRSQYLRTLCKEKIEDDSRFPRYGIDNIVGIVPGDGNVVNKENKIVAMYENSILLDEFDMASKLAAEQGRIDREREAAKKAASEKVAITNKYGKKYADAFFAGKVIVGMPWSLVEIGLDAHSFSNFYTALLSYERNSASGTKSCYSLIGDDLGNVGHMWVANGAVESISYY